MKRLKLPNWNPFTTYVRIAEAMDESEDKELLLDPTAKRLIRSAFRRYSRHAPEIERIAPMQIDSRLATALRSAYWKGQTDIAKLEDHLASQIKKRMCFYCRSERATSLDHILPRKLTPEFSLYIANLVPACAKCNGGKKNVVTVAGKRCFFYAFKDTFPKGRWLFARVDGDRIRFTYNVRKAGSGRVRGLLERQLRQLKLAERFELEFAQVGWSDVRESAGANFRRLRRALKRLAINRRKEHGPNNYHAVLFDALSRAPDDFLKRGLRTG